MTPFIVAEIGSNWSNLEDCLQSIRLAKVAGADAVKFQLFNRKALYGMGDQYRPLPRDCEEVCLNPKWLPQLKEEANRVEIEFMCSAFSPEFAEIVNPYVNIHKIASAEMNHVRLLQKTASFNKPIFLSVGASTIADITQSLSYLKGQDITLMYCVASYPAKDINPDNIQSMANTFKLPIGYSDHSTDIRIIPKLMVDRGAVVIEKHANFTDAKGADSPHSLNFEEFKIMVKVIRGENKPYIGPVKEEESMVTTHKRRLKAVCGIMAGDEFIEGKNFGIFRSIEPDIKALSPFAIDHVIGKIAKRDIMAGEGIGPSDIE